MAIRIVGVLGCGLMGSGIAQVVAQAGYRTIVREVDQATLDKGFSRIRKFLGDGVEKGKLTAEARDETLGRLSGTTAIEDLAEADLVIEAIVEDLESKRTVFEAAKAVVRPDTIFATNTSSLCITELASVTDRPQRFAGLHFFNPVPLMKLVEVIRGLQTSDETARAVFEFAQSLGKEPVSAPDRPGFIVNRLLFPYLLDAVRAYERGLGSIEEIDKAMKLGCGHPMGPFALIDYIGIDTTCAIAAIMFDEFKEPAYVAPPLLKRMLLAGHLGKKSGQGFYKY